MALVPVPDPLYDAVGRVVVESARLEAQAGELVAALMLGPLAIFAVRGQSPDYLKRLSDSLLANEHVPEPLRGQCQRTLDKVWRAQKKRDHIVHGAGWVRLADDKPFTVWKPTRFKIRQAVQEFSVEDLLGFAHEMAQLSYECYALAWNVQAPQTGMPTLDVTAQALSAHVDSTEDPDDAPDTSTTG